MSDSIKNVLIGFFVLAATCIVIFILMFLNPRVGDKGKILKARFTNIDKVSIGTRVTYGGKPVGEVVEIKEVEFGREGRTDTSGHIYLYELLLQVDSSVNVFNSDELSIRTSGLLGEKNVEITPLAPKKDKPLKQIDGQVLFGTEAGSVEDTLKEFKEIANEFERTLKGVSEIIDEINASDIVTNISKIANNVVSITDSLNQPSQLSEIIENIHVLSRKANASWDRVDQTLHNIDIAAIQAQSLFSNGHQFFTRITDAEGTFNKIFFKDELYLRTNSILSKFETILDDVNHYGLLFSSDKGWQRLRARRLNLLQRLSTPQEFRNYFNDEIDQISTSISRVSMILDKVATDPYCNDRMQDREFTKVFSELLRRVSMLEEEVRLYNTQLVETEVQQTELAPYPCCPPACYVP